MQRPQVDLAVKRRLKRVWVSIRVIIVRIFSKLPRLAREGGNYPSRTHPPSGPDQSSNPSYTTAEWLPWLQTSLLLLSCYKQKILHFKCYFKKIKPLEKRTTSLQGTAGLSRMSPLFGGFTVVMRSSLF